MLKAYSKRLKERNIMVNNTVFSFDKDGYCSAPDVGNARLDFALLLKMNQVSEVCEAVKTTEVLGEERAADLREGIDTAVLDEEEESEEEESEEEESEEEESEEEESEEEESGDVDGAEEGATDYVID